MIIVVVKYTMKESRVDDSQRKKIYKNMLGKSVTIGGNGCQRLDVRSDQRRDYEDLDEQLVRSLWRRRSRSQS